MLFRRFRFTEWEIVGVRGVGINSTEVNSIIFTEPIVIKTVCFHDIVFGFDHVAAILFDDLSGNRVANVYSYKLIE